jgi:hypothetical protein
VIFSAKTLREKFAGKRKTSKEEQQDKKRGKRGSSTSISRSSSDTNEQEIDTLTDSPRSIETVDDADSELEDMATDKNDQSDFIKNMLAALENEKIARMMHGKTDQLLEKMDKRMDNMEEQIMQTNDQVSELQIRVDEIEQRVLCNEISVSGVPPENMTKEGIMTLLNTKLGTNIAETDILYTLKMSKDEQEVKRMKVVFKKEETKQIVTKLKKKLKDQDLWISDVLTPYRMNLAYLARKARKEKKLAQTWVYEGKIFIKANGESKPKKVNKPQDLPQ